MSRTLEILERLIAFPTISSDSNLELIDWIENLLQNKGFSVTRLPSPDGRKAGLFARIGPEGDGGICLSAHSDVVPVDGQDWARDAFALSRDDTRLYGRGTTDMKGFLASALALAERVDAQALRDPLSLVISYDEEVGCVGIRQMLPALAPLIGTPRAVIVGEPTAMQVAIGHKGKAALRATCTGQAGHSALAPNFVNAIHVASGYVTAIRDVQNMLFEGTQDVDYDIPYCTVHIGKINGGRALNIVPDSTVIDLEYRHLAETPGADIHAMLEAAATRVMTNFNHPAAQITLEQINAYPGLDTPADAPVVHWARTITDIPGTTKVAFGTEAGFFAQMGLPTVVIGPGDMARDGHKPDEGLDLSELAACDAMMDRILADLAG